MRLKVSMPAANERLVMLVNEGYGVLEEIKADFANKKGTPEALINAQLPTYEDLTEAWADRVIAALEEIFPTELENNVFRNPEIPFGAVSRDYYKYNVLVRRLLQFIRGLETIRQTRLREYTDLQSKLRLFVEDIDSFHRVRDVNPAMVTGFLDTGFLDWSEDSVQQALERILDVPVHKKDWSGEANDLYTANVVVNGRRHATAFLLKGPGIGRRKEMTIADCGRNGDQIVRLFETPADLFVVQYVGSIAEMVVKDVEGKAEVRGVHFLIIEGQDTARLLFAYGILGARPAP